MHFRSPTPAPAPAGRPVVRGVILSLALLLAGATLPLTSTVAVADAQDDAAETAAGAWLVAAYDAGDVTNQGALGDLVLALSGAGHGPTTVADARTDLEAAAAVYLAMNEEPDAGVLGKSLLAVIAGGGDGTDVDGQDLEATLRGLLQLDGPDAGRFDDATVFAQSLAILGLAATDAGAPTSATDWVVDRRCPDGGWPFSLAEEEVDGTPASAGCTTAGDGDIDTTALAVQALLDADQDAALTSSSTWLADQQAADGSFDDNANSTGLAGQALRAVGLVDAADLAADFIVSLQVADGEDAGAIRFRTDDDGSFLLATTQGILALGAPAYSRIAGDPGRQPEGDPAARCADGVTVVVDLTFFDGGEVLQGCSPGDPASGLAALRGTGLDVTTSTSAFGEFVCAVQALPERACEQPFEGQYWAYFSGQTDGTWVAAEVGADATDPAPGDIEGWAYSDGSPPTIPATGAANRRLAGATRIDTAIQISRDVHADGSAGGVVLTRADQFADALAGTPLAAAVDGPVLTTASDNLPAEVSDEIQRVLPAGGTVHVLGGVGAISDDVAAAIEALGFTVERVAGTDRITTAIAVAGAVSRVSGIPTAQILITTGSAFADALSAGTAAAATDGAVVVLTGDGVSHPAVDDFLAQHQAATTYGIGGPAATAYPEAIPVVGPTREATAVAVAQVFFPSPPAVAIARRDSFADALAGGAHIASLGGPLLITATDSLHPSVRAYLCQTGSLTDAVVYGGTGAISDATSLLVGGILGGGGCGS